MKRRLKVGTTAIPSANNGIDTLSLAALPNHSPVFLLANANFISLLTPSFDLIYSLNFDAAFPSSSSSTSVVSALSFDATSNRIAAAASSPAGAKLAFYEQSSTTRHLSAYSAASKWRVHSTLTIPQVGSITTLDFKNGKLAIGGQDSVQVWELAEALVGGQAQWVQVGEERLTTPCLVVRLSPSAGMLASVKVGANFVRLSSLLPPLPPATSSTSSSLPSTSRQQQATTSRLQFLCHAWHAQPIRAVSWRPTDSPSDSGPILFTTTMDNHFHIWGCMIDEPEFFSLWATVDVHPDGGAGKAEGVVPLSTNWWRSEEMFPATSTTTPIPPSARIQAPLLLAPKARPLSLLLNSSTTSLPVVEPPTRPTSPLPPQKGRTEYFVTAFSDSSFHVTAITNFDRRPPTCLTQSSLPITFTPSSSPFPSTYLNHLRYTLLLPSTSSPPDFLLIGRSSRGGLTKLSFSFPIPLPLSLSQAQKVKFNFLRIPVNFTGKVRKLVHGFMGESIMALGEKSMLTQSWEVDEIEDEEVIIPSFVGPGLGAKGDVRVAVWHDGKMLVTLTSTTLTILTATHNNLKPLSTLTLPAPLTLTDIATFFVARTEEESLSTTICAVVLPECESDGKGKRKRRGLTRVKSWTWNRVDKVLRDGGEQVLSTTADISSLSSSSVLSVISSSPSRASSSPNTPEASSPPTPSTPTTLFASPLPIKYHPSEPTTSMSLVTLDSAHTLSFWTATIPDSIYRWKKRSAVRISGKGEVLRVSVSEDGGTAIISEKENAWELSIWDSKESEFASGELHSQDILEPILDMHWSLDGGILALATTTEIKFLCAMRLDDLSGKTPWGCFASVKLDTMTQEPISCISWLTTGLAVAAGNIVVFFSSKMMLTTLKGKEVEGDSCHTFARAQSHPLPFFHPQLLFQSLLHDRTEAVIHVLKALAAQLTVEGELNPIETESSIASGKVEIEDFLKIAYQDSTNGAPVGVDLFSRRKSHVKETLTEDETHKLLKCLKSPSLRGLSELEHSHLAVVVQTVFDIQRQQGSLDANGLRFLISMRSFYLYSAAPVPVLPSSISSPTSSSISSSPRLKFRDAVWAFHSDSQELLIDASVKACPNKLLWNDAKALSFFLWIKSPEIMNAQMEAIARAEYIKPDRDEKDPITASLFYLALRKKHMVFTLWKQAGGHDDQRNMVKLLANDFELPRWKSAALKNAFVLLSKRRFFFAAVFFLLGDSLKDAVNVCLRQLDDFQLAIAIARVYEGDDGPVLKSILEDTVLPLAFKQGFRWLASWAFWMLNRRDLAIQTIVTPLEDLASGLPYKLVSIGRPMHEDPCLVLLFNQLRSFSLQTLKGATTVSGRTEFNFLLHMARVLTRMGCQVLALNLLSSWEFLAPEPVAPRPKFTNGGRRRSLLRRGSTVLDLDIPSNLASRAPSPDGEGGAHFHRMLKETKAQTKAPPEFSMDAFASFGF